MNTQNNNRGVLIAPRLASQWLYGIAAPVIIPQRGISAWTPFLPESEAQSDQLMDTGACLTFSALHCIESQVNADIANNRYPQATVDYFHSAGYMVNGKFKCSARYSAKMNGTSSAGNYPAMVGNGFLNKTGFGLLPETDLPFTPGISYADYYAPVTPQMVAKAKLIYQYITINYWELTTASQMAQALLNAPVQVCTPVCPGWDSGATVGACGGSPQHATMVYGKNNDGTYEDFDTYTPFKQNLAGDYDLIEMYQYIAQPASAAVFTTMKIGSSGSNVQALQESLKAIGYFPASQPTTQYFGGVTFGAVEAFQRAHNLQVDGIWGTTSQATLDALKKN